MPCTYNPNAGTSTESFPFPNPGEQVTAESVAQFGKRLADRMKAIVHTVTDTVNVMSRALQVNDNSGHGFGVQGVSSGSATSIGVSGQGPFGVVGTTSGDTILNKAVSGIAALGGAVGVYGRSAGGYALEGNGQTTGKGLLSRGHIRFAQHGGTESQVNPGNSVPFANTITAANTVKAWGHVFNGVLLEGFNVSSVVTQGPLLQINFAHPFSTGHGYGISVTTAEPNSGGGMRFVNPLSDVLGSTARTPSSIWVRQYNIVPTAQGNTTFGSKDMTDSDFTFVVFGRQDVEAN